MDGSRGRVLVVDDEEVIALDLQHRLRALGYDVPGVAGTPDGALRAVAQHQPDVVLMDVNLAGADGIAAAAELRRRFGTQVVYVTGYAGEDVVTRAKATSPLGFLLKPVNDVQLNATLDLALARAREDRARLDARMRALVQASPDGLLLCAADGTIVMANPRLEELLGYERGELLGANVDLLVPAAARGAHAEHRARFSAAPASRPMGLGLPLMACSKDGAQIPVDISLASFRELDQTLVVAVVRDLRPRRALEASLARAERLEAIGRLAGGLAHDINNLLTTIGCNTEFVAESLPQGELQEALGEIRAATRSAAELVRDLLAFGRRQIVSPRVTDPNAVVTDTLRLARRLIDERVSVRLLLSPDVGRIRIDPTQLEQMLLNLCSNARDAMPDGGTLTIETQNVELDAARADRHGASLPGPHVMLAVSDTGHGMDAATRERIFEPFFTTKELGRGTGLGLASVYGIVAQSGGSIAVYSEPGLGTTFKVFLPRVDAPAPPAEPPSARRPAPAGRETVLVVEDSAALRRVVVRALSAAGYAVLPACDGAEALALAEAHPGPIALVLTDVVMPGLTGRELAARLETAMPNLRVLFTSGYTENAIVHQGALERGVRFLPKPFSPAELLEAVRAALDEG